jgi:hypothetical protein
MIRNIRHIQVKKIAYHPNLFKAILTFEGHGMVDSEYDESDDIEYIKYLEHQRDNCPHCEKMEKKRREIDKWER